MWWQQPTGFANAVQNHQGAKLSVHTRSEFVTVTAFTRHMHTQSLRQRCQSSPWQARWAYLGFIFWVSVPCSRALRQCSELVLLPVHFPIFGPQLGLEPVTHQLPARHCVWCRVSFMISSTHSISVWFPCVKYDCSGIFGGQRLYSSRITKSTTSSLKWIHFRHVFVYMCLFPEPMCHSCPYIHVFFEYKLHVRNVKMFWFCGHRCWEKPKENKTPWPEQWKKENNFCSDCRDAVGRFLLMSEYFKGVLQILQPLLFD